GDYLKVKFPICPLEYYQAAEKIIADKVSQPHFYIFSDDMVWVKENLHLNFPCTFVDFNKGSDSWQDMVLMSHCRHHIIANSTFSRWGAWLGNAPNKIVISPKTWIRDRDPRKEGPVDWIYI
ncbi:MAG: alpha-1,2-fucosyltransferase, partial [Puniceicoccales bacterium]|nr:alpha-1,2-fucosyltransferase [Puniceicoccales bacterium]